MEKWENGCYIVSSITQNALHIEMRQSSVRPEKCILMLPQAILHSVNSKPWIITKIIDRKKTGYDLYNFTIFIKFSLLILIVCSHFFFPKCLFYLGFSNPEIWHNHRWIPDPTKWRHLQASYNVSLPLLITSVKKSQSNILFFFLPSYSHLNSSLSL